MSRQPARPDPRPTRGSEPPSEPVDGRLVLRVKRGERTLGSWRMGEEPVEIAIVDMVTGKELGSLTARGALVFEVARPVRVDDDDFTMPLPEHTEALSSEIAATDEVPRVLPRPSQSRVPNLAARRDPEPEHTESSLTGELLEATHEVTLEPDLTGPPRIEPLPRPEPPVRPPPRPQSPPRPAQEIRPAEVWVRRKNEWRSAGHLAPGQRVPMNGGWIRLGPDGRLAVCAGPTMTGSATLSDGRSVDIASGSDILRLPGGTSVILRQGEQGLYVRSEVVMAVPRPNPPPNPARR